MNHLTDKDLELAFKSVLASLAAAISLLERGGKKAAPSDRMFNVMLSDYRKALEAGRAALLAERDAAQVSNDEVEAVGRFDDLRMGFQWRATATLGRAIPPETPLYTTPPKTQAAVALALKNAAEICRSLVQAKMGGLVLEPPRHKTPHECYKAILASIPPDAEAALKAYVDERAREALGEAAQLAEMSEDRYSASYKIRALIPAKEG